MYRSFSNSINKRLVLIPLVAVVLMGMMSNAQDARAQEPSPEIAGLLQQIESLMQILVSLQEQVAAMPSSTTNTTVAAPEGGFADQNLGTGSGVETTATLRVRANAGTQAAMVSSVPPNTGGTIIGGPQFANGYTWWNVQYGNGTQGWSAGNWLKSASNSSSGSTTGSESTTNDAAQTNTGSANFAVRINGVLDTSTNVTDLDTAEARCSSLLEFNQGTRIECYWGRELIGSVNVESGADGGESYQAGSYGGESYQGSASSEQDGYVIISLPLSETSDMSVMQKQNISRAEAITYCNNNLSDVADNYASQYPDTSVQCKWQDGNGNTYVTSSDESYQAGSESGESYRGTTYKNNVPDSTWSGVKENADEYVEIYIPRGGTDGELSVEREKVIQKPIADSYCEDNLSKIADEYADEYPGETVYCSYEKGGTRAALEYTVLP